MLIVQMCSRDGVYAQAAAHPLHTLAHLLPAVCHPGLPLPMTPHTPIILLSHAPFPPCSDLSCGANSTDGMCAVQAAGSLAAELSTIK